VGKEHRTGSACLLLPSGLLLHVASAKHNCNLLPFGAVAPFWDPRTRSRLHRGCEDHYRVAIEHVRGELQTLPMQHELLYLWQFLLFILVTLRVKGYIRFVGKYVTDRMNRFRPYKVYVLLIRITSRVKLAMSVCPSVCPSVWTLSTRKIWKLEKLGLGMQILEVLGQRKCASEGCHGHSKALNRP